MFHVKHFVKGKTDMNEIAKKRGLMEVCQRLIPDMEEIEINTLATTLNTIIEHMIKRGVEVSEEE